MENCSTVTPIIVKENEHFEVWINVERKERPGPLGASQGLSRLPQYRDSALQSARRVDSRSPPRSSPAHRLWRTGIHRPRHGWACIRTVDTAHGGPTGSMGSSLILQIRDTVRKELTMPLPFWPSRGQKASFKDERALPPV